jgi:hypothetical protein
MVKKVAVTEVLTTNNGGSTRHTPKTVPCFDERALPTSIYDLGGHLEDAGVPARDTTQKCLILNPPMDGTFEFKKANEGGDAAYIRISFCLPPSGIPVWAQ